MGKIIIHKVNSITAYNTKCNINPYHNQIMISEFWEQTTCKNCLKQRVK